MAKVEQKDYSRKPVAGSGASRKLGFRFSELSETKLPVYPILGNVEALGRRKGPRSNNLGPLPYTQHLVDWLLMQAINPTPNQPSLRTRSDLRVQPCS
jgi:hypothetical protein